jgi:CHAD domain-containing protein
MNTTDADTSKPNASQVLLEAIENGWRNYLTELKRCRTEFSNEAVHDLRVATRRMMAIIQLLNSIAPRPRLRKIIRAFKDQLDEFDDLRDTQVILAEISETLQELPELQAFQKHEQFIEEKLLRKLRKEIKKSNINELSKRIRKTQDAIENETNDDLEAQIMQAVDDAYLITKQRLGWVDLARSATIHRVRVAFKSFRYMVEIIQPLLNEFPPINSEWMNNYQSLMGEVQDAEVFMQTLADYSEHASFADPDAIHRYYERRHAESISAFAEEMNQLHIFWRPAPDQPFPWEKTD